MEAAGRGGRDSHLAQEEDGPEGRGGAERGPGPCLGTTCKVGDSGASEPRHPQRRAEHFAPKEKVLGAGKNGFFFSAVRHQTTCKMLKNLKKSKLGVIGCRLSKNNNFSVFHPLWF